MSQSVWQEKASAFVEQSIEHLWSGKGIPSLNILKKAGLSEDAIRNARIGYNPENIWKSMTSWGLPPEIRPDGSAKKLWLPPGIVLSVEDETGLCKIRVWQVQKGKQSPYMIPGSRNVPLALGKERWKEGVIVTESEIQAHVVHQFGAGAIALAGVRDLPSEILEALEASKCLIVSVDQFLWKRVAGGLKNAKHRPYPKEAGADVGAWVRAVLPIPSMKASMLSTGSRWSELAENGTRDFDVSDIEEALFCFALQKVRETPIEELSVLWGRFGQYWARNLREEAFSIVESEYLGRLQIIGSTLAR